MPAAQASNDETSHLYTGMPVSALNFLRRLVVAAIIRGDLVAGRLERFGDCRADTACSPRHQRVAFPDRLGGFGCNLLNQRR
jgi:hypothetical protein